MLSVAIRGQNLNNLNSGSASASFCNVTGAEEAMGADEVTEADEAMEAVRCGGCSEGCLVYVFSVL